MPRVFLPSIASAVLLWAAFFPLDLGVLGFVALVPWLSLVRAEVSRRRRYFAAYVGGFVFSAIATQWVRVAHPMMYGSWAAFSVVLPLFWVLALDFIRRLDRLGVPHAVAVPVTWVALEYVRMHFPTGFPFLKPLGLYQMIGFGWYFLGYTQHANVTLIQIADLGGVYAVSFVVAAVNGAVADWVWKRNEPNHPTSFPKREGRVDHSPPSLLGKGAGGLALSSLAVLVLVGASFAYGYARLRHPEFALGPRVAAIQGDIPQSEKNLKGMSLAKTYYGLNDQALRETPRPDLIVWPETCCPSPWFQLAAGEDRAKVDPEFIADAGLELPFLFRNHHKAWTLYGLNALVWEDGRAWKYNSALLLSPDGDFGGRYDKMHLVPFGEYVPLGELLPFMRVFTPYKHDYSCRPGSQWTRFALPTADGRAFTFACLICYEDSDPYLARQYVATEPVNFFVNISNDGWFDGTEEHEQHLAICRFRAIETRRSIVRAVNMGISAVIDPDGRVIALPGPTWSASKKMEGVVSAAVPLDTRESQYARLGDWVPAACWLVLIGGMIASMRMKAQPT